MVKFPLSMLSASVFSMNAAADPFDVNQPSDGFLNLQSGPGVQFNILRRIYPGDQVRLLNASGT